MSKTSLKQGIEDKLGGLSNISNTIVKQDIEAEARDIAPMFQYELAHLCLRLGLIKALNRNEGIAPMCLRPL